MDGLILDLPTSDQFPPFAPPVCVSPLTAQILAIALVVLVCASLMPVKAKRR